MLILNINHIGYLATYDSLDSLALIKYSLSSNTGWYDWNRFREFFRRTIICIFLQISHNKNQPAFLITLINLSQVTIYFSLFKVLFSFKIFAFLSSYICIYRLISFIEFLQIHSSSFDVKIFSE